MGFGFGDAGSGLPYIKYNAKAGLWLTKDEQELDPLIAIAGWHKAEKGWCDLSGATPQFKLAAIDAELPQRPDVKDDNDRCVFKPCIKLPLKLGKDVPGMGGEMVEVTLSAKAARDGTESMYDAFLKRGDGMLPVFKMAGRVAQKSDYGTNYMPTLEIVDWVSVDVFAGEANADPAPQADQGVAVQTKAPPPADNAQPVTVGNQF